jgi:hypothetical protein
MESQEMNYNRFGRSFHPFERHRIDDIFLLFDQVRNEYEEFEALQVSEVSSRSGKGRHTTRHVSLLRLPGDGGLLADTPGFSQPSLNLVTSGELGDLFPEVRSLIIYQDVKLDAIPSF